MIPSNLLTTLLPLLPLTLATSSPKRGLCHISNTATPQDDSIWTSTPNSDLTWYYNYGDTPSPSLTSTPSLHFVPMLWGASDSTQGTPFLDSIKAQLAAGANITHVLAFNEPDGTHATGGSNIPVDLAASTWKAQLEPLRRLGIKVGAPAVTGSPGGFTWLQNWGSACGGGCTPDFVPVHWYGNFEGLASHVGQVTGAYPNLTVWVTEWGMADAGLGATQAFFNESLGLLDRWENVTHYSYFGAFRSSVSNIGPNAAMLTQQGKLTDIGSWYLGGAATGNVPLKSGAGANAAAVAAATSTTMMMLAMLVGGVGVVCGGLI